MRMVVSAGDGFAVGDGPLDGRGAAIFREQRGVQVDVAERREIEHPLRDDAAVADDDDGVGLEGGELGAEFFVGLDAVGLGDGEIQFQGGLFYWAMHEFEAAAFGAVGLRDDEVDAESGGDQFFERRDGEGRRAAENVDPKELVKKSFHHRDTEAPRKHKTLISLRLCGSVVRSAFSTTLRLLSSCGFCVSSGRASGR